jgi:F5/8 type C domain
MPFSNMRILPRGASIALAAVCSGACAVYDPTLLRGNDSAMQAGGGDHSDNIDAGMGGSVSTDGPREGGTAGVPDTSAAGERGTVPNGVEAGATSITGGGSETSAGTGNTNAAGQAGSAAHGAGAGNSAGAAGGASGADGSAGTSGGIGGSAHASGGGNSAGASGTSTNAGGNGGGMASGGTSASGGSSGVHELAAARLVTASTEQPGNEAPHGNDGDLTTRWCAKDDTFPQWWRVDLGVAHTLSAFSVQFQHPERVYTYHVETSPDDAVYTLRSSLSGMGTVQSANFPAGVSTRYVRITVTDAAPLIDVAGNHTTWACFYDFSVTGS